MDTQIFEKLQRIYDQADSFGKELMKKEFPELRVINDDTIRNFLINLCTNCPDNSIDFLGEIKKNHVMAWLEKQGKEWSEEDEDAWDIAIRIIQNGGDDCAGILDSNKALNWLKSLKQRFTHEKEEEN